MNRRHFTTLTGASLIPTTAIANEAPLRLRVLSFNLRYINKEDQGARTWTARRDAVGALIKEDNADLIGFQEALRPMLDDVRERVPGYQEIGVGREDGKQQGEYSALFVRKERFTVLASGTFWLSDTPDVPNSRTWKNRVTRICTWAKLQDNATKRTFHFYNTHFDHESQEAREKGATLLLQRITERTPAGPVILTGDLNSGETNIVIDTIKKHPLQLIDTWRKLHPDTPAAESGTMHTFTGAHDKAKIDYIFVPANTRLIDAAILHHNQNGNYPSDHFPIRATIEFA
jgi:endonuclease/exonuclease/phosphatase family metal-dependent hydrolase